MSNGFSSWATTDRLAMHEAHAARAKRFMLASATPYQGTKYNGHVEHPTGPKAERRRAVAEWNVAIPPVYRQRLHTRILARREVVGRAD